MSKGIYLRTKETIKRLSLLNIGRPPSKQTKHKMSLAKKGISRSEETKRKISLGNKGKIISKETRKKLSLVSLGKHHSPGTEFKKGNKLSEETKLKISLANKGKPKSKETRKKMSIAKKGFHPITEFKKGHLVSKQTREKISLKQIGKHPSEETKKKLSLANKGKRIREKSPTWLGGKSFEPYGINFSPELKESIRKKYNYRCQECFREQDELRTKNNKPRKLTIHHIDYNKRNNQEENLIPLCISCHSQTNFNREDWTNYFQNKVLK